MSGYTDGRRAEWTVIYDLQAHGYWTIRAAGSKGAADVVAIKPGQVLFVSVKRTTGPRPAERLALVELANRLPGVGIPLIAIKAPRQPIQYRVCHLDTYAPQWTPDFAETAT